MTNERYPILVESFKEDQSLTIVCVECDAEEVIGPDDILNDAYYACPAGCPAHAVYKYEEGTPCLACGDLCWDVELREDKFCSARCKYQHEYAQQLRGADPKALPPDVEARGGA